ALTVLALAPSIVIMLTCFTRMVIVLSFLRQAIGAPQMPPNQILTGLALFLTVSVMAPVGQEVHAAAIVPYMARQLSPEQALTHVGPDLALLYKRNHAHLGSPTHRGPELALRYKQSHAHLGAPTHVGPELARLYR